MHTQHMNGGTPIDTLQRKFRRTNSLSDCDALLTACDGKIRAAIREYPELVPVAQDVMPSLRHAVMSAAMQHCSGKFEDVLQTALKTRVADIARVVTYENRARRT